MKRSFQYVSLVSGTGMGMTKLTAFDAALLSAGVAGANLVKVSSVIPPECQVLATPPVFKPGAMVPTAYAAITSDDQPAALHVSAAVAAAELSGDYGLIMEYSGTVDEQTARMVVEAMVREGAAHRTWAIKTLSVKSASQVIGDTGFAAAFAAVVFW